MRRLFRTTMALRAGWSRIGPPFAALWLAVTCVLAWIGIGHYHGDELGGIDHVFAVLRLFVFEGSEKLAGPEVTDPLRIARLMAPLFSVGSAAYALVRIFYRDLRLSWARGHVVVLGLGARGRAVVERLVAKGENVLVVENAMTNDSVEVVRDLGAIVVEGDASTEAVLAMVRVHLAHAVYVMTGDEVANLEAVELTQALRTRRGVKRQVDVFLHIREPALHRLELSAFVEDSMNVRVVDADTTLARRALTVSPLDYEPITSDSTVAPHLVIVGTGSFVRSLALHAIRTGAYANGKRLAVTIVGPNASRVVEALELANAGLRRAARVQAKDVVSHRLRLDATFRDWALDREQLLTIAVCLDDKSSTLRFLHDVPATLLERRIPFAVRTSISRGFFDERLRLETFAPDPGDHDGDEALDETAKAIHERYRARLVDSDRDRPANQPWAQLRETYRAASRCQADHIAIKHRAILAARGGGRRDTSTADQIELLARMEHNRWMVERELAGWRVGREMPKERRSPYLVPFEDLPDHVKRRNRDEAVMALELIGGKSHSGSQG